MRAGAFSEHAAHATAPLCYIAPVTARDLATLFALGALWGASYIFIRITVPAVGPWGMVGGRMLISALAMYAALRVAGLPWGEKKLVRDYLVMAFLSSFLAQYLIGSAALHLNAGTLAMLNTTASMFSAVLLFLFFGEPMGRGRALGMLLGMAGVALVVGFTPQPFSWPVVLSLAGTLAAACSYACSNIYASRKLAQRPALELAFAQSFFAGLLSIPFAVPAALAGAEAGAWTPKVLWALAALALVCTALANGLFYSLMKRTGPTVSLSVTYLIPAFSLLWGWLFLGETIALMQLAGFAVIVAGLMLVVRRAATAPVR